MGEEKRKYGVNPNGTTGEEKNDRSAVQPLSSLDAGSSVVPGGVQQMGVPQGMPSVAVQQPQSVQQSAVNVGGAPNVGAVQDKPIIEPLYHDEGNPVTQPVPEPAPAVEPTVPQSTFEGVPPAEDFVEAWKGAGANGGGTKQSAPAQGNQPPTKTAQQIAWERDSEQLNSLHKGFFNDYLNSQAADLSPYKRPMLDGKPVNANTVYTIGKGKNAKPVWGAENRVYLNNGKFLPIGADGVPMGVVPRDVDYLYAEKRGDDEISAAKEDIAKRVKLIYSDVRFGVSDLENLVNQLNGDDEQSKVIREALQDVMTFKKQKEEPSLRRYTVPFASSASVGDDAEVSGNAPIEPVATGNAVTNNAAPQGGVGGAQQVGGGDNAVRLGWQRPKLWNEMSAQEELEGYRRSGAQTGQTNQTNQTNQGGQTNQTGQPNQTDGSGTPPTTPTPTTTPTVDEVGLENEEKVGGENNGNNGKSPEGDQGNGGGAGNNGENQGEGQGGGDKDAAKDEPAKDEPAEDEYLAAENANIADLLEQIESGESAKGAALKSRSAEEDEELKGEGLDAESEKKWAKKQRTRKLIAMIGDIVQGFANLWGASQGAVSQKLSSLSGAADSGKKGEQTLREKRRDEIKKKYEALLKSDVADIDKNLAALRKELSGARGRINKHLSSSELMRQRYAEMNAKADADLERKLIELAEKFLKDEELDDHKTKNKKDLESWKGQVKQVIESNKQKYRLDYFDYTH